MAKVLPMIIYSSFWKEINMTKSKFSVTVLSYHQNLLWKFTFFHDTIQDWKLSCTFAKMLHSYSYFILFANVLLSTQDSWIFTFGCFWCVTKIDKLNQISRCSYSLIPVYMRVVLSWYTFYVVKLNKKILSTILLCF